MSVFGEIVTGRSIEEWCVQLAQRWISTYLSEIERQAGLERFHWQRPRAYVRTVSFDKWPEDQLPALMFVSSGIAAPPTRTGDGLYTVRWLMNVAALCSASTQQASHDMAHDLIAATEALFVQRPSLDGHADALDWLGVRVDDLGYDDGARSLSSAQALFSVEVRDVISAYAGPAAPDEPSDDPWPNWATARTVEVNSLPHETTIVVP